MKKLIIRALAGLLASVVLVACVSLMGNMPGGKRTDGIFYEASGIHPDATLMTVNKQPVTAEEFLLSFFFTFLLSSFFIFFKFLIWKNKSTLCISWYIFKYILNYC